VSQGSSVDGFDDTVGYALGISLEAEVGFKLRPPAVSRLGAALGVVLGVALGRMVCCRWRFWKVTFVSSCALLVISEVTVDASLNEACTCDVAIALISKKIWNTFFWIFIGEIIHT